MKRNDILARMGLRLPLHKQIRVIISSDVKTRRTTSMPSSTSC
jgi:hypothetical protein